jgi:xanthine dehydrogenase small subunit
VSSSIRFLFRGEVVELAAVPPTMSVLHWLRAAGHRGTKEGCNQGDCGACTVVLGELVDGVARLHTANSCLLLVPMLHGKALFTVEDVGTPATMHPVQAAMAEHGGSQCGFCTPGFVMSMWCSAERAASAGCVPSDDDVAGSITGNLCRCTGYRPIVDAAREATAAVVADGPSIDLSELAPQLTAVNSAGTFECVDGSVFVAPDTEKALATALADRPSARLVSGGTDVVVAMRAAGQLLDDVELISTMRVGSLLGIAEDGDALVIGAAASLEDSWAALVRRRPMLGRMHERFAGPAIRSTGTIGGNIANSSPIADLVPVLIALDASVEMVSSGGSQTLLVEDFATGVRANRLAPGEFLARIRVPLASFDRDVRAHKVSRRFDDDISSVSGVFAQVLDGDRVAEVRAVFGGMATTVRRAASVESSLIGAVWDERAMRAAREALSSDFAPIDDHRATGWYRMQAARGLIERWWLETGIDAPAVDYDVWSAR